MRSLYLVMLSAFFLYACRNESKLPGFYLSRDEIDQRIEEIIRSIAQPEITGDTINLIAFSGMHPDEKGSENFQPFINLAIQQLAENGGGWLLIPADQPLNSWLRYTKTYRIDGPVLLDSNVGILIERSVRLFFPFDPEKYLLNETGVLTRYEGTTIYSFSPLFRAFNEEDIIIRGIGDSGALPIIDGDGEKWQRWMWEGEQERSKRGLQPSYQLLKDINNNDLPVRKRHYTDSGNDYFRPEMMEFFLCKSVLVEEIKLTNSPFWCIKPVFSESCIFRNLAFDAMNVNNDGVDPVSSRNVLIENIMFGNHDDNVAIKAGRDREGRDGAIVKGTELEDIESPYIKDGRITGPCENIVIRNCNFSGHHAICIGSEMSGSVRNVYAVDNYSVKEVNMGLFIKGSRLRGGIVENVYINNMKLYHTINEVISIVPNYDRADQSPYPPLFKNIQVENVICQSSGKGILVYGWPDMPVKNVLIRNCKFSGIEQSVLIIKQSKSVVLENLFLNGTLYNENINDVDQTEKPPERI